jgi:hypothetical protein
MDELVTHGSYATKKMPELEENGKAIEAANAFTSKAALYNKFKPVHAVLRKLQDGSEPHGNWTFLRTCNGRIF